VRPERLSASVQKQQALWAGLLAHRSAIIPLTRRNRTFSSQWRDRAGFSPASLLFPLNAGHPNASEKNCTSIESARYHACLLKSKMFQPLGARTSRPHLSAKREQFAEVTQGYSQLERAPHAMRTGRPRSQQQVGAGQFDPRSSVVVLKRQRRTQRCTLE